MGDARTVSFLQSLSRMSSSGDTYSPSRRISTHQPLATPQFPSLSLISQNVGDALSHSMIFRSRGNTTCNSNMASSLVIPPLRGVKDYVVKWKRGREPKEGATHLHLRPAGPMLEVNQTTNAIKYIAEKMKKALAMVCTGTIV